MLHLKNNLIMAPVKTGYGDKSGNITVKHLRFYEKRAPYLGALTPEPLYIDSGLRELPTQIGIDNNNKIPGLKSLTDMLHKYNTKAIAHLNHPGRMANPKIPGNYFMSSSEQGCETGGPVPKEMDEYDINKAIELWVNAAIRAEKSGFDFVELQFGHGYLVSQFISTKVNSRNDKYGGDFDNRTRLAFDVLEAVKKAIQLPIIIRISGDEMMPDGIKIEDMVQFATKLQDKGVAAIHVSSGSACNTPPWYFQHMFVPKGKTWELAQKIKSNINIPVIFVGQVSSKDDIEQLNQKYHADYIAIGRAMVADPDFAGIVTDEISAIPRPCMECSQGCLGGVKAGKGLQCLVNPEVGSDITDSVPVTKIKKIAVIGGGLAGMEATLVLKKRGHDVDLFEADELGGQFNFAHLPPGKKSMSRLISFYINSIIQKGIPIIKQKATMVDIIGNYDEAVIATGSEPLVPSIEGLKKFYWAEILNEKNMPENKNVLIIGGGLIGVDVATALVKKNNKVTMVKRTDDFGGNMELIAKTLSMKSLREHNTVFSEHTHIKKIDGSVIYAEKDGLPIQFVDIDIIVVSAGMKSFHPLAEQLNEKMPVHIIGDANKTGDAQSAISDAWCTAINI